MRKPGGSSRSPAGVAPGRAPAAIAPTPRKKTRETTKTARTNGQAEVLILVAEKRPLAYRPPRSRKGEGGEDEDDCE
ncbi:MAG TPA: hypothetical protein VHF46_04715, partial [Rubrobacteraceae bacterium]|nr:hypothetical protein [Rubrobacteraceae bacterium]